MTPCEVTVRIPDPSALDWEERANLRGVMAGSVRRALAKDVPVGVDLLPADES